MIEPYFDSPIYGNKIVKASDKIGNPLLIFLEITNSIGKNFIGGNW